jgi:hypothetical protein
MEGTENRKPRENRGDGTAGTTRSRGKAGANHHHRAPLICTPTPCTPNTSYPAAWADPRGGPGGPQRVRPRSEGDTEGVRGGGLGQTQPNKADAHPDEMRQVPTHPTAHSQPIPSVYKTPYEPPQATTLLDSGSINHRDPPNHTRRYQLPTPAAHSQPAPRVYKMPYKPPTVATPYNDNDDIVSNRRDIPPGGYQPQLPNPTSNAQPPLQPPDHNKYTTSGHDPHSTSFGYHENEGDVAPMEPD